MGLIAFLKKKFGKHTEDEREETEKTEVEKTPASEDEQVVLSSPIVSDEERVSSDDSSVSDLPTPGEISIEAEKEERSESTTFKEETAVSSPESPEDKIIPSKGTTSHAEEVENEDVTSQPVVEEKREMEEDAIDKYVAGLDKSRLGFTERLHKLASSHKEINQEYFDSLEQILFEADVGYDVAMDLIKEVVRQARADGITDPDELNDMLIDKMFLSYANEGTSFSTDLSFAKEGPTIVLMCGVNGSGKTTTIAKLAYKYKARGKRVLLVAGDTFRAGAVEQLEIWAERIGVDITSRPGADPASLCYDSMRKAIDERYDIVFVDTAGRLQNKKALMDELSKVVRVIRKVIPDAPHEALLVMDANTGQNGIDQAMVFKESAPLTGIVVTKMDGTSKGGIILAIRRKLGLPVRFIGLGEKMDDLEEFDLEKYLYGLLVGKEE